MKILTEGKASFNAYAPSKISKEMPVFYNPIMKLNRDVSILLLNSLGKNELSIALPLAGSGVRGIRFLLEVDKPIIKELHFNDHSPEAVKLIGQNARLNQISNNKFEVHSKDANLFLLESEGFDYIDIDPFGSPNPYLDSAIKRLSREGILAVTATDTSALAGSHPKACARKYWAKPLRNEFMHETGLRILIRKVQLVGAQYSKALVPIFCYSKHHYYRVFFRCVKGKSQVDKIMPLHGYLLYCRKCLQIRLTKTLTSNTKCKCGAELDHAGLLWIGKLWDARLCKKMLEQAGASDRNLTNLLDKINEESNLDTVGFYTTSRIQEIFKPKKDPKIKDFIEQIKATGEMASRTHFDGQGIRTTADSSQLRKILS